VHSLCCSLLLFLHGENHTAYCADYINRNSNTKVLVGFKHSRTILDIGYILQHFIRALGVGDWNLDVDDIQRYVPNGPSVMFSLV